MIKMTKDQTATAVALLNSYAHQYLGLSPADVLVAGGIKNGVGMLALASASWPEARAAPDFDEAKRIIDEIYHGR